MIQITPELLAKMGEAIAKGGNVRVGPPRLCWEVQVEGNDECSSWVDFPIAFLESPHFDEESILRMARDHYGAAHGETLRRAITEGRP